MKKTSVQFFATFFAFAICMLFASQGFSQTKGTIVKSGTTDAAISVTKIFEFDKGGITFRPLAGDAAYTVYEKSSASGNWMKTNNGTILSKDGKSLDVCNDTAYRVKVEIKVQCDGCVDVQTIDSCGN